MCVARSGWRGRAWQRPPRRPRPHVHRHSPAESQQGVGLPLQVTVLPHGSLFILPRNTVLCLRRRYKQNNTTVLHPLHPPRALLGLRNTTSLVIDRPGACPVGPSDRWTFQAGLLRVSRLCLTAVPAVPVGYTPAPSTGDTVWPAVTMEPCGSISNSSAGQQHWTRDGDSRFHLGRASGSLCLNGLDWGPNIRRGQNRFFRSWEWLCPCYNTHARARAYKVGETRMAVGIWGDPAA